MTENYFPGISRCPLFAAAEPSRLNYALSMPGCGETVFQINETVSSPDNNERRIGIILCGGAKVRSADGNRNVLLRTLVPGDLFGVANLFDGEARYVSHITAKRGCRVFFICADAVSYLLENDAGFMYAYIGFLSGRIRFLNRKIMYYTCGGAERRLALYLTSFGTVNVTPDLPMNALAELLDIGRASLYRAVDSLINDGYISRNGNGFILTDVAGMIEKYYLTKKG